MMMRKFSAEEFEIINTNMTHIHNTFVLNCHTLCPSKKVFNTFLTSAGLYLKYLSGFLVKWTFK